MSGKYINKKRIAISVLTLIMVASQLVGVSAVSKCSAAEILNTRKEVEIEYVEEKGIDAVVKLHIEPNFFLTLFLNHLDL